MTLDNFSLVRSLLVFAVDVSPATQWDLQFWGLKNNFLDVKLIFLPFYVNVTLSYEIIVLFIMLWVAWNITKYIF